MENIKIIAVDDEVIILNIIKMILGSLNFEITACSCGKEYLNLLEKSSYDLVLFDIMMPELV